MNRWSKNGVLERMFARLQQEQMIRINADAFSLDSTVIKVHPDGTGALKKWPSVGSSCGGWTTKLHLIAASAECAVIFSLSPGQAGDAPEGRRLLTELGGGLGTMRDDHGQGIRSKKSGL